MTIPFKILLLFFLFIIIVPAAHAQVSDVPLKADSLALDTLQNPTDLTAADTLQTNDSIHTAPVKTTKMPEGDIKTTVKYSAKDSMKFSMDTKKVFLYGDAKVTYDDIKMEAALVEVDYTANTITANGSTDESGEEMGMPVFHNGNETYVTKGMTYNFKTKRAQIKDVVTVQGEGFIRGEKVFKNEDNELFSYNNTYTTCNLEHPHFRIRSKKTKAIPNDKIVSGPFNLEINNVPTPLGFPFGMFPAKKEASSGIIIPSYGEERLRGFYLRGAGYFFDISDYMKIKLTGDIYTKGGHGVAMAMNYKKRYKYNGSLTFNYTQQRVGTKVEDEDIRNDYRLRWNFTPETKGPSRFSASVNAATSTFNTNNNLGVNQNINRKLNSSISYSKTFRGTPFSMGLTARHTQDVSTRELDLLLPDLSLNMENVYPFKKKGGSSKTWYQKIALRWSMNGTNRIDNNLGRIGTDPAQDSIAPFTWENLPQFLKDSRKGFSHNIPLSTSLKLLKYFTLSPNFSYRERWYFEKLNWIFNEEENRPVSEKVPGFNRVATYSGGVSLNTRIYGTKFFKKGKIQALRHVMTPNLSLSYTPDFGDTTKFDYYQGVVNPSTGKIIYKSRHEGFVYGGASLGESGSIGLGLSNTLEMKVKNEKDTLNQSRKVSILNNFGFNTSYNIVADSFNLSNISFRANTALFQKKLSVNFTGTIDPYLYRLTEPITFNDDGSRNVKQRKIDEYAWNNGQGIGQLRQATIALGTNLSPKARQKENTVQEKIQNSDLSQADKDFLLNNPETYVDFNIPWSLRINYSLSYNKTGFQDEKVTQSLRFSGDLSLSEKWKVTFNSGYDFENKDFTQTNLGISRDLHCWEMNFNWTPFGRFTSYDFTIRVKSSLLQDLKINRTRSFFDNTF